jgi:hypothetical protein
MGNPLTPIIVNLFMSRFEMNLAALKLLPRIWYRYVNDIFAVVKKAELANMLNAQYQTVKVTVEE